MAKRIGLAVVMLLGLFAGAFVVADLVFDDGVDRLAEASQAHATPARPERVARDSSDEEVKVLAVQGRVEYAMDSAKWRDLTAETELPPDARVRTFEESSLELKTRHGARVTLGSETEATVAEVSQSVSRLLVGNGLISAAVPSGAGRLRVEFEQTGAVAETIDGEFSALSGAGQVAVAAKRGSVDVEGRGKSVRVGVGQQSIVVADQVPTEPEAIPASFFLKVAPPSQRVQRQTETTVRGQTSPGSIVSVNGVRARAGNEGEFSVVVPLRKGRNRIHVTARDSLGRTESRAGGVVRVDRRPPASRGEVQW